MTTLHPDRTDPREVEELFYREADLLDEYRFEEWLDLLDEDFLYRMPLQLNLESSWRGERVSGVDVDREIAWFDEDKRTLGMRVRQLTTGEHWAEQPLSRTVHMISNIRVVGEADGRIQVTSRFHVYRNRVEDEADSMLGSRTDVLVREDGELRFLERRVRLMQSVLLVKNLSVIV